MGAGEPFLAFESLMKALSIIADPKGLHIVPNRVTVSTAGIVPRIKELATMADRPHLAVSLGAPTDEQRDVLMPINRKWPLAELLGACKEFERSLKRGERFTFEYVMLRDVNDSDEHARQLAKLLNRHELRIKVNLIPHNEAEPLPYHPSSRTRVEAFKSILEAKGIPAFVRRPRGQDIFAACGQLAAEHLLQRGFRQFAFHGFSRHPASHLAATRFQAVLRASRCKATKLSVPSHCDESARSWNKYGSFGKKCNTRLLK
jgi:23S rRNA (adenine2503-C2)-methyltransferase